MPDDLSLLFRLKAENSQAKAAIADTRAAVTGLRTHFAGELQNMNTVTQGVFGELTKHLNVFVGERVPLLGGAFLKVTENVREMGKEVESAGGGLSALGGVAGVAALAVTALGAASVGLGVALFEIVKKSSEVGLELDHFIEKTGLSAKTVTSLKFAAEESGQSLQGFDVGMKLFANTIAKAAEGSDQAAQSLKRLGITPKEALSDLDGALAKVFKRIYDAPSGVEKMSLAADAFGRRMGANLIPLIESFHGDLGELIKRAEELGVTLDEDGVKSLAEFQRNMNSLQAQVQGLERTFATELAPTLIGFLKDLSHFLAENKDAFSEWGSEVGNVLRGLRSVADSELGHIIGQLFQVGLLITGVGGIVQGLGQLGSQQTSGSGISQYTNRFLNAPVASQAARRLFRPRGALETDLDTASSGGGGGGRAASAEKLSAAQKLLNQLTDEYTKLQDKTLALTERQIVDGKLQTKEFQGTSQAMVDQLHAEADLVDQAKKSAEVKKNQEEATKKIRAVLDSQTQSLKAVGRSTDEYDQQIDHLIDELKSMGLTMDAGTEKLLRDNAARLKSIALLREHISLTEQHVKALEQEIKAEEKSTNAREAHDAGGGTGHNAPLAPALKNTATALEQLHAGLSKVFSGKQLTAAQAGVEALTGAFEGLGNAVGSVVQAWVLYGSAGTSVRKVTAEILAGVAQQAAIKAVFELAEGFAALAMAFFGIPNAGPSAHAHFVAAGIYGSIAGVAAIAGREVAGGAFAQGGSATGASSGSGSSSGSSTASQSPGTIKEEWVHPKPQVIILRSEIHVQSNDSHIVKTISNDVQLNGQLRDLIVKTAKKG